MVFQPLTILDGAKSGSGRSNIAAYVPSRFKVAFIMFIKAKGLISASDGMDWSPNPPRF